MQLTLEQAAGILQVPMSQVRRWIRDRGLPAVLFNEQYHLNRTDLFVWAQANRIDLATPAPRVAARDGLGSALERGGIARDLPGATRAEVLQSAIDRLRLPDTADRDLLRDMILARHEHGATPLGRGIALPHARYPNVSSVPDAVLGLSFLRQPVDFGAADGRPVGVLILLVTPSVRVHLELLARLARALETTLAAPLASRADDATILAAVRASEATVADRR